MHAIIPKSAPFAHLSSRQAWFVLLAYLIAVIAVGLALDHYTDRDALRSLINEAGTLGTLLFLAIEYVYILFVPIYNTPIHLIAGFLFGGPLGWLLNFLATTAALLTLIVIVQRYGRPLLNRLVSKRLRDRYDVAASRMGPMALFLVYVLPGFPDDEITYIIAAGGQISLWRFILPVLLGNATKSAVSYIGVQGSQGLPIALGSRLAVLLVGLILISIQEYVVHRTRPTPPKKGVKTLLW